jgi:hypothetical protein
MNNYEWHMKDGVLTFTDTGEQWEVSHWTDEDYDEFLSLAHEDKCGLIEGLDELQDLDIN